MLSLHLLPAPEPARHDHPAWLDAGFTAGWLPAFRNRRTGEVRASHLEDGRLACTHILDTVPGPWVAERDEQGRPGALISDIQAGYLRGDRFFTLAELLRYPSDA